MWLDEHQAREDDEVYHGADKVLCRDVCTVIIVSNSALCKPGQV